MRRLKVLRLVVSHTQLYRKLDEFGQDYNRSVKAMMEQECDWMESKQPTPAPSSNDRNSGKACEDRDTSDCGVEVEDDSSEEESDEEESESRVTQYNKTYPPCQPNGQKITIDNIDYTQQVHHMTQEHQTIDKHYLTVCATTNRISGNHLSREQPDGKLNDVENGKFIPNHLEHFSQRNDYIHLTERVLVKNIPCLQSFENVVVHHIPHVYSKEAREPTHSVSIDTKYTFHITNR